MNNLKKLDQAAANRKSELSPIVTLSTTPKRIMSIKPTLVSLLKQTIAPSAIQINLGKNLFDNAEIPSFLESLNVVKINFTEQDLGPATKLIPTLEQLKGTDRLIVVVDDDMFYHETLLEQLIQADKATAGTKCCCANGFKIPKSLLAEDCVGDKRIQSGYRSVGVMQGAGGYTVRAHFLDPCVLRNLNSAPERALFEDDVWFSGHLSRNKISKIQIPTNKRKSLVNTLESAITGDRSKLMTNLLQHFAKDWEAEEFESPTI